MRQFASAGPMLHAPTRKASAPLPWAQATEGGRIRAAHFVVAVA